LEDDRPEINDVFKRTPDAGEFLIQKDPIIFIPLQFQKKKINNPFDRAIREGDGYGIALQCVKKGLGFDCFSVLLVHLSL